MKSVYERLRLTTAPAAMAAVPARAAATMAALEASPVAASLPVVLAPVAATATVLGRLRALGLGTLGLGLAGLFLGFDLLGRHDDRALGDSGVIGGVDRGVARADGLTCLVGDAVAELFLVAIVNDFAACRRLG